MNAVIRKRDSAARRMIRPFAAVRLEDREFAHSSSPAPEGEAASLEFAPEVAALRAELDARQVEIETLVTAVEQALEDGKALGQQEAVQEQAAAQSAMLARLERGADQALEAFRAELGELDRLAAAMVELSLGKIFDEPDGYADLIMPMVRRQLRGLDRDAVLRIEVAIADFPNPAALEAMSRQFGNRVQVDALNDLAPGDCRIQCRLGSLQLGVGRQWGELKRLLAELGEGEA